MTLSGQQRKQVLDALMNAFPSKSTLQQLLFFELDKNLDTIAGGDSLREIVFQLIRAAESEGWLEELIKAAHHENPGNPKLRAIVDELGRQPNAIAEDIPKTPVTINELIENAYSQKVTTLNLSDRGIGELPPAIGKLTNLKELDLSGNTLTQLPIEISLLTNLEVIKLSGNRLNSLFPLRITQLQKLTILDLSKNQLSLVPVEITSLKNLKGLNLSSNDLVDFPNEIENLVNLTTLDISENRLSQLPEHFINLKQLTSLDISRNQFDTFPEQILFLSNLRELIVSNNHVNNLPANLSDLIYLQELDVSYNRLSDVPNSLINLKNLTSINFKGNPFTKLPESFTIITEPSRLFNYLIERAKGEEKFLAEIKLLIVGEAEVGKTSLVNRLIYNTYNPQENTTKGISIIPWEISVNNNSFKINIWDFGGQEIMHATHQFFLTKRSIYVLVIDSRRGEHESRLEYWLKLIRSFGGNSPILVICNKADQNQIDLNWTGLQNKYGIDNYARAVSCETEQGIDEIRTYIAEIISKSKDINEAIPENWLLVKSKLKKLKDDYISYEKYQQVAIKNGIKDSINQENLLRYLHDLGVALWFGDDPRLNNTNVLNPEWVTSAIYQILNSNLVFRQKGRLKIKQLEQILDIQKYPKIKHSFIIDIMKRFELCFSFDNSPEETVLIPDLLQKEEPYTGNWSESLLFQIHYDVLPGSIISRFIVRMHNYALQETYWRNGIVLKHKDNETKALVIADSTERKIFIKVCDGLSNIRHRFLEVIRSNFREIHDSISNLGANEFVTVPKTNAVVSYESLLKNEQYGIDKFIPSNMNEPVSVKELLDLVDPPEKRIKESYFETRGFDAPIPTKLREILFKLEENLITIPVAESFDGRNNFLSYIPGATSLNRSTINARNDISQIIEQLQKRSNQFSPQHPLSMLIDNAFRYVQDYSLGQELETLRAQLKEVFEELNNDQQ